ncbi:MAG: hypothetical protein ABSG60_06885, partial [Terracidiphilus sp.]
FRVQEGVSFRGLVDTAGDKQLGEDLWQAGCFGQCSGLLRMRRGEHPALAREGAGRGWLRYWAVLHGAHPAYSSSSSRSRPSMTMS